MTRVLVVPPQEPAFVEEVDGDDLDWIHDRVGGYFEEFTKVPGLTLLWNESSVGQLPNPSIEALLNGWEVTTGNRVLRSAPVSGTVVVTGPADSEGGITDVPQEFVDAVIADRRRYPDA